MSDDLTLFFEPDSGPLSSSTNTITTKPTDDFTTPPLIPNTIFFLSITTPKTDSFRLLGPVKSFASLIPDIESLVSNSPSAINKFEALRTIEDVWGETEPNHEFAERGFSIFIVEGQREMYTVLKVERRVSKMVWKELPSPVYTVTRHGPLIQPTPSATISKSSSVPLPTHKGYAQTSHLISSYVSRAAAKSAAESAMQSLLKDVRGAVVTQSWEKGTKGAGVIMAMMGGKRWEVRVGYEDQVLKRAREEVDREGGEVGWRL